MSNNFENEEVDMERKKGESESEYNKRRQFVLSMQAHETLWILKNILPEEDDRIVRLIEKAERRYKRRCGK